MLDVSIDAVTDTGYLTLFEPIAIARVAGPKTDWCVYKDVQRKLINEGLAVFIETAVDGIFRCRITDSDLTQVEKSAVCQTVDSFWINVQGYEVVFGGLEAIPDTPEDPYKFIEEFGETIPFEPGRYRVTVHRLIGPHDEDIEELLLSQDQKVPAFVIVLRRMAPEESFAPLEQFPSLSLFGDS